MIIRRPGPSTNNDTTDAYALWIVFSNGVPHYAFSISDGTLSNKAIVTSPDTVRASQWVHVAGTYDGTNLSIYLNGTLSTQTSASITLTSWTSTGLYVGRFGGLDNFTGLLDEVRLWNITRTSLELASNKDNELTGSEAGLAGYWKLEGDTTLSNGRVVAKDYTTNKNDLLNTSVYYFDFSPLDPIGQANFSVTSPASIDFGTVEQGSILFQGLTIMNPSAYPFFGIITTSAAGVKLSPTAVYVAANSASSSWGVIMTATSAGTFTGDFAVYGNSADTALVALTLSVFPLQHFDANNIDAWMSRRGSFGLNPLTQDAGFEWPKGSDHTVIYESGLWIGAKINGQIRMATAEYQSEFEPGPAIGGTPSNPLDPQYRAYKINAGDNAGSNTDYAQWPGNLGAPLNSNGTPQLLGSQTIFAVYNDLDPAKHVFKFDQTPMGAEVQQTTFGFDSGGVLSNTVFLRYKIINRSSNTWHNTYIALWSDPDLGNASDDLVGIDTARTLGFTYNGFPADVQYGVTPPAVGYKILKGAFHTKPIQAFARYYQGAPSNEVDPSNVTQAYNYIQGLKSDGSPYIAPSTTDTTKFPVSGDPVTGTGWIDTSPGDRRFLFSTGPLDLEPGQSKEFIAAIIIAQGSDRLNSITKLREGADSVQLLYDEGRIFGGAVENVSSVTLPKDSTKTLDDVQNSGATLGVTADSTGATVEVASYVEPPAGAQDMSASSVAGVGKYLDVDVQGSVTWPVQIRIYYTQNDLDQAGVQEGDLQGIYYWSGASNQWNLYSSSGTDDQGRGPSTSGVNTTDTTINIVAYAGYVYASAYHLTLMRIGTGGGFLPVQMSALSAEALSHAVNLHWMTMTEVNCYGFDIERSRDGSAEEARETLSGVWKKVGFVRGAGTSAKPIPYLYIDRNLMPGPYSYRIKKMETNGKFSYTPAITVTVGAVPRVLSLSQNYPNPFNPTTTIEFTVPNDGRATLKVYNSIGQKVATLFDGVAKAGEYHQVGFDGLRLASGVYFTRIEFGGKQLLKKMLLLK
jgi:hypothetical protein